jgi:hypothetical protein
VGRACGKLLSDDGASKEERRLRAQGKTLLLGGGYYTTQCMCIEGDAMHALVPSNPCLGRHMRTRTDPPTTDPDTQPGLLELGRAFKAEAARCLEAAGGKVDYRREWEGLDREMFRRCVCICVRCICIHTDASRICAHPILTLHVFIINRYRYESSASIHTMATTAAAGSGPHQQHHQQPPVGAGAVAAHEGDDEEDEDEEEGVLVL